MSTMARQAAIFERRGVCALLEQDDGGSLDNREKSQLKSRIYVFTYHWKPPLHFNNLAGGGLIQNSIDNVGRCHH